jgi:signal peptidase II
LIQNSLRVAMRTWGWRLAVVALAASTIGCDRLTKRLAIRELSGAPSRSFLGNILRLEYAENRGAFLGIGNALPDELRMPLLIGVTGLLLISIGIGVARGWLGDPCATIGLTLVWAGGVSNLADRIARGHVVDFLNVGVGSLRTGIFNLADLAITCGLGLVLLCTHRSRWSRLK